MSRLAGFRLLYLNEHTRLVVRIGGKCLGLLSGDGGVPFDKDSHHSSSSLNSQGQGCDIQQEQVLHILRLITGQDGSLHSCKQFESMKLESSYMNHIIIILQLIIFKMYLF